MTNYRDVKYKFRGDSITNIPTSAIATGTLADARISSSSVTQHVTAFDDNQLKSDIALVGFKAAKAGSLAKYNLVDQTEDTFADATGINASASGNELRSTDKYYTGVYPGNYFGDASDGTLTTTGNVTHTVQNKSGSYDGDMVFKQYQALTISAGHVMQPDQPCRGMFIMVKGDCVINGTLNMKGRGGFSNPTTSGGSDSSAVASGGLQLGLKVSGGSQSFTNDGTAFAGCGTGVKTMLAYQPNIASDGTIFTMSKLGGVLSPGTTAGHTANDGEDGATGATTISTGGGSAGEGQMDYNPSNVSAGDGGAGGAFSGGAGGGSIYTNGSGGHAGDGVSFGGAGGNGQLASGPPNCAGGAGNPGGTISGGGSQSHQEAGVGGIIWLLVGGDLTIGYSGSIDARGSRGGNAYTDGGGSGGGAIFALYVGTLANNGSITAIGGYGGEGAGQMAQGGDGGVHTAQISQADQALNMTLVSAATQAETAPTKADIVFTYQDAVGTNTVGTDLTAEVSADNGSTWTSFGIGASDNQGPAGGDQQIITKHDVTITSTITSPYNMVYRIKTLNQSATKECRIHAVSLGWT